MEKFLRDWRQDALNKHQYDSAIFIGDKLLALTQNDKDAFWLAQSISLPAIILARRASCPNKI